MIEFEKHILKNKLKLIIHKDDMQSDKPTALTKLGTFLKAA